MGELAKRKMKYSTFLEVNIVEQIEGTQDRSEK